MQIRLYNYRSRYNIIDNNYITSHINMQRVRFATEGKKMKKSTYSLSPYGRMRDKKKNDKKTVVVSKRTPYKTILANL